MRTIVAAALLFALSQVCVALYEGNQVYSFDVFTEEEAHLLLDFAAARQCDLWTERVTVPGVMDVHCDAPSMSAMMMLAKQHTISHRVLHADLGADIEANRIKNAQRAADGGFFDSFATYDQMNAHLAQLASNYSDFVSLVTIGQTVEGRNITGLIITSPSSTPKPAIVFNGCQHAREWISPMTVAYVAQSLIEESLTNPSVKQMIQNYNFTIVPIVNADGYVYTQTDRMWRKNRRSNPGSSCKGVDINRNWDYEWGTGGSSSIPCSDTYKGPSGFSEPEESSLGYYIGNNTRVQGYIDFHSYGNLFMSPWGWTKTKTKDYDVQQECCKEFVDAVEAVYNTRWKYGPVYTTIYPASGGSNDWTYGQVDAVYSFAAELRGNSFIIDPDQIIPSGTEIWAGVQAMVSYMAENPRAPSL